MAVDPHPGTPRSPFSSAKGPSPVGSMEPPGDGVWGGLFVTGSCSVVEFLS